MYSNSRSRSRDKSAGSHSRGHSTDSRPNSTNSRSDSTYTWQSSVTRDNSSPRRYESEASSESDCSQVDGAPIMVYRGHRYYIENGIRGDRVSSHAKSPPSLRDFRKSAQDETKSEDGRSHRKRRASSTARSPLIRSSNHSVSSKSRSPSVRSSDYWASSSSSAEESSASSLEDETTKTWRKRLNAPKRPKSSSKSPRASDCSSSNSGYSSSNPDYLSSGSENEGRRGPPSLPPLSRTGSMSSFFPGPRPRRTRNSPSVYSSDASSSSSSGSSSSTSHKSVFSALDGESTHSDRDDDPPSLGILRRRSPSPNHHTNKSSDGETKDPYNNKGERTGPLLVERYKYSHESGTEDEGPLRKAISHTSKHSSNSKILSHSSPRPSHTGSRPLAVRQ
jgi:hypothetical protein